MPVGGPMVTWCEPMQRGDLKLAPSDIQDALAWFKETTGHDAKLIVLNPKNDHYAREAGDGVKVEYLGGCLTWEVWLSAEDNFVTQQAHIRTDTDLGQQRRNEIMIRRILPIGRPSIDLPMEKVTALAAKGLGYRAIAKTLQAEGIQVSHMAVSRAIKKLQRELPTDET